jgi:hypothetical protein
VLYSDRFNYPQDHPPVRHRCRNPRCGAKLKPAVANPRDAFCRPGCFDSFYRRHCLVCERSIIRGSERQILCGRVKCKRDFQRHRERFEGTRYLHMVLVPNASRNPIKSGLKIGTLDGRPFAQIAGAELTPTSLRLATLPLDPELVARLERAHRPFVEALRKSKRAATRKAAIKRHHPPVNVVAGFRFPGAPAVDLRPIDPPEWAIPSRWKPTGRGVCPPIPEFLLQATAAIPTAAETGPTPCLVPALVHVGEEEKSCGA